MRSLANSSSLGEFLVEEKFFVRISLLSSSLAESGLDCSSSTTRILLLNLTSLWYARRGMSFSYLRAKTSALYCSLNLLTPNSLEFLIAALESSESFFVRKLVADSDIPRTSSVASSDLKI